MKNIVYPNESIKSLFEDNVNYIVDPAKFSPTLDELIKTLEEIRLSVGGSARVGMNCFDAELWVSDLEDNNKDVFVPLMEWN